MTCERFDSTETFERYLAGTLSDPERDAFEEHYFGCDRCFEALRILRATREALRAAGPLVPATPIRRPRRALWAGIGIAAALFAAALILPRFRSAPPASPPIAQAPAPAPRSGDFELEARMEPPAWDPQLLRGAESTVNPRLQQAMAFYTAHDYPAAAAALHGVLETTQGSLDARYFLGICELLTGQLEPGIAELRAIVAAGSASPYLEEAHFYLGKAFLKQGNLIEARRHLELVARQSGDLHANAAAILARLPIP